ncbi:MAG TPA: DUF86 domain-containing protein [Spirochaetota bacterium]|nr:DUF86 domain-containing protein [Spirochaetota bacterium]HPJ37688.1 DUF86 domain-containing protein [Spirochaetota bacterium]HPQ54035.1 DUF86 domain-containing protein [Spirochaetota bacterium]
MVYRKESVVKRIGKLKEYMVDLQPYSTMSAGEFKTSKTERYAVERILFLIAECIIDVLDHFLSAKHGVVSEGYEDIIDNALENSVIDAGLYEKLKGLGGFRNVLAHGYLKIDSAETHSNMVKMTLIMDEVITRFEEIA